MNVIDALYARRAVKHFDASHKISREEELKLLQATIQAPTSFNIQHWRFVILRESNLRHKIRSQLGNDQSQITDASLLILFVGDTKAWLKNPEQYWVNATPEYRDMVTSMMTNFYRGREALQRDEAQRSIGMALQSILLAALELGYETCPMIGFDIDAVAKLVGLPNDFVMGPMVAIGRGTKPAKTKGGQLPLSKLVYENSFDIEPTSPPKSASQISDQTLEPAGH